MVNRFTTWFAIHINIIMSMWHVVYVYIPCHTCHVKYVSVYTWSINLMIPFPKSTYNDFLKTYHT